MAKGCESQLCTVDRRARSSRSHSGSLEKSRSARSSMRYELVDSNTDVPEEVVEDLEQEDIDDYENALAVKEFMNTQWNDIYEAIENNDADLLDSLVPPINAADGTAKYWMFDGFHYGWRRRGTDILSLAISKGHTDCVRVLLNKFYTGELDPMAIANCPWATQTPLLCACRKGDCDLVRELVEHAHVDVHRSGILFDVVEMNHPAIVEYLLDQGINLHARHNLAVLHKASRRGHLAIVEILLEHGADPNVFDDLYKTAFDHAMDGKHIEVAELLVHYTCGSIRVNRDDFTPLMIAAHRDVKPIVDLLFRLLPNDRAANDLLKLACRYTVDLSMQNLDRAVHFFSQDLERNEMFSDSSLAAVYDLRFECRTVEQLESIRNNVDALYIHASIVNERLFLQYGEVLFYIDLINKRCRIYSQHQRREQALQLRIHACQSILQMPNHDEHTSRINKTQTCECVCDLENIFTSTGTVPIDSFLSITHWIVNGMVEVESAQSRQLLKIIFCMVHFQQLAPNNQRALCRLIRYFVQQKADKQPFLAWFAQSIAFATPVEQYGPYRIIPLDMIRFLIRCGADVNQISDCQRNRPLNYIAQCRDINMAKPVIELLLRAGAHPDTIDNLGRTPKDLAQTDEVKKLLIEQGQLSLKCRCAQLIVSKKIRYENHLTSNLISFVRLHSTSEPNPMGFLYYYGHDEW